MDLTKEAIEKIESLVDASRVVTIDGVSYSSKNLGRVKQTPRADPITVHSLDGFIDYVNKSGEVQLDTMVIVDSPTTVNAASMLRGDDRVREYLISCTLPDGVEKFPFGKFLDQETFAIKFRALFKELPGDDTGYCLSIAAKLSSDQSTVVQDDGVTQQVNIKKGVSGVYSESGLVKPIVRLSPYRTFREIEQPQSEFLIRVRKDEDTGFPNIALFEADGGAWVITAREKIKEYLEEQLIDRNIIA